MSRPPRFSYAHALHHVTLRCNNREFLFAEPSFELFRHTLAECRAKFPLHLFHYCLMTNHVHLLFEVGLADTLSRAMHWLSTNFSRRFNKAAGRKGHLWEGRFRSTIIEADSYFLRCMAYVDLNPVRAGLAATPEDYPWSGHRALRDEDSTELAFHPLYLGLGLDAPSRYGAYMALVADEARRPPPSLATEYFAGRPRFVARMERRFGLDRPGVCVERRPLGSGVVTCRPRRGRVQRSK